MNGYYAALPQVLKTKYGIPVMTFDVTHFNVHDSVQAEALVTLVSAFLREDIQVAKPAVPRLVHAQA